MPRLKGEPIGVIDNPRPLPTVNLNTKLCPQENNAMADPTTIIDVVDTIVKIGLGAAISAVAGHFGTKQKYENELHKAALDDASALLKDGALKFEESCSQLNTALSEFDSARLKGSYDFAPVLTAALAAYNKGKDAKAIFYLIGALDLGKLVVTYLDAVEAVRDTVGNLAAQKPASPPPLANEVQAASSARIAVLEALGPAYEAIRGAKPRA
jgi:hypothetical protein